MTLNKKSQIFYKYLNAMQKCVIFSLIMLVILKTFSAFAQESSTASSLTLARQMFVTGQQLLEEKQYEKAALLFAQLVGNYPLLQEYVQFLLAESYRNADRKEEALLACQKFFQTSPDHPLANEARLHAANLLVDLKKNEDAIPLYQVLLAESDLNRGEVDYKLGLALLEVGQDQQAVSALAQSVYFAPRHGFLHEARKQLDKLLKLHPEFSITWTEDLLWKSAEILLASGAHTLAIQQFELFRKQYPQNPRFGESELKLADAYFQAGKPNQARQLLQQLATRYAASQPEIAAQALYTLGAKDWYADVNQHAKSTMQQIVRDFKETSWADDAHYVIGRIFQAREAYPAAAQWYAYLQKRYPTSSFAEEALWRAGWSYYLAQEYAQASRMFARAISAFPAGNFTEECLYWYGRSAEHLSAQAKQQDSQAAIKVYRQLLALSPESYYGIRAQERLRLLKSPVVREQKKFEQTPTLEEVVKRVQDSLAAEHAQFLLTHLRKAFELAMVQQPGYARQEIAWIENRLGQQLLPEANPEQKLRGLYLLARAYTQIGDYLKGIQLTAVIESLLSASSASFPYPLDQLKYPLAYWDTIIKYAEQRKLDPYFVAGIIRQESAYNPLAISYANARGLMQVIPPTAQRVARRLDLKNFTTAQLYEPDTNIAIGTAYIAEMLEKFDGNLFRAIAAYNAGPNATKKWWPEGGAVDDEEIVENITYQATRNYVKRVLRNQYNYRQIYGE